MYSIFFVSGFAALLYQVIWQRMLAIFSGVDVFSVTIIVAAFMAGLGCGNLVGGQAGDRLGPRLRLILFGLAELSIAGFALISKWLYYDVLYLELNQLGEAPVALTIVLFAALLWPTFFMGMSLPLLATTLTKEIETAPRRVGALYGLNTLGAAFGAFASAWLLVRRFGFEGTIEIGAVLNAFCALGAFAALPLLFGRSHDAGTDTGALRSSDSSSRRVSASPGGFRFSQWLGLYCLSGFIALSLEILWFRLLGVMIKSSAFTFGTLLTCFLLGLAAGTLLGIGWAQRSRFPVRTFLALQAGVPIYAGLSLTVLVLGAGSLPGLGGLWTHLGSYEPIELAPLFAGTGGDWTAILGLYALLPLLLIGPPTLLMGASFPFLQKIVQTDPAFVGRRVGWLQTANIVGSMLGSVLVGAALLGWIGSAGTLRLLVALGGVFAIAALRVKDDDRGVDGPARVPVGRGRAGAMALLAFVALLVVITPSGDKLWASLHGTQPDQIIVSEDGSGVSVLKMLNGDFSEAEVFVNGRGQSQVPFGGIHTELGALPVLVHPNPVDVAVIGLGSGDTVFSVGGRQETERIDCFEIIAPQLETLDRLYERNGDGGLGSILNDERIAFQFTDGRAALMRGTKRYDVIEADALRPNSAYAGNLYSEEFFRLLKDRLKPGGLAVTWGPTERVGATFVRVFPYVRTVGSIAIGSNRPIPFLPGVIRQRAASAFTRAYYAGAGIDSVALTREILSGRSIPIGPDFDRAQLSDFNTDLFPKDEFLAR